MAFDGCVESDKEREKKERKKERKKGGSATMPSVIVVYSTRLMGEEKATLKGGLSAAESDSGFSKY